MKTFEQFVEEAKKADLRLKVDLEGSAASASGLEAIFHTPLMALCLLSLAHSKRGKLGTGEISQWLAAILPEVCFGNGPTIRRYEWSVELRARCAEALEFLEGAGLVSVEGEEERYIVVTEIGKTFLAKGLRSQDDLGVLLRNISRAEATARSRGLMLL